MLASQLHKIAICLTMVAAIGLLAVTDVSAEQRVPVRTAVQTTIGPSDAPVRTADFSSADRARVTFIPAHWGHRRRAYAYYAAPVYDYCPAPAYSSYYAPAPYAAYYYPGPVVYGYRGAYPYYYPRRAYYRGW